MNRRIPTIMTLCITGLAGALVADEALVDPERPAQSQAGAKELVSLQDQLIKSFQNSRIEKNYLGAQKLAQLDNDEITRELLQAAIGSMRTPNMNYKWYVAHLLKKISGKKHGANQIAWQTWLDDEYVPVKRKVYRRPIPTAATTPEGSDSDNSAPEGSGDELDSGSVGHDSSGGVKKEDVPPSPNLGHDPNDKVVDPTIKKVMEEARNKGAGAIIGPGGTTDLPKEPPVSVKDDPRGKVILTTPREDAEKEAARRNIPGPDEPGEMVPVSPGN